MKATKLSLLLVLSGAVTACAGPSKQRSDPANPPIIDDPEVAPIGEPRTTRIEGPTTGDEQAVALGGTQSPEGVRAGESTVGPTTSSLGPPYTASSSSEARKAEAELKTVEGVSLDGEATLREVGNGVQITLKVEDAKPGKRGVHIHERGDCSNIAGKSMGEHFSPDKQTSHGLPTQREHHFGDLGNISVAGTGKGQLDIIVPGANLLQSDTRSLLGKAVVIHEREDVGAGPTGESGSPIACAIIIAD
jgi:Cu-Zn family superoxide dismutase